MAAPLTSIDLTLSSGQEIVIEERSPKELLNSHGGLGEQVAASGICVWNPAFDVTPADLIAGIITEKVLVSLFLSIAKHVFIASDILELYDQGVITKTGDVFDIKDFIHNATSHCCK